MMSEDSGLPKNFKGLNTVKINVEIPPMHQPPPSPDDQYDVQPPSNHPSTNMDWRQQGEKPCSSTAENHRYRTLPGEQPSDMQKFVQKIDSDNSNKISPDQVGQLMSEINSLKEVIQKLNEKNQELRDSCCYLDDDRKRERKLARKWQKFGRLAASVMKQEVAAYQMKLKLLDAKQRHLIKYNSELEDLCLYLDEELSGRDQLRDNSVCRVCENSTGSENISEELLIGDEDDGSSSSTNADEDIITDQNLPPNQKLLNYIRQLEAKVEELEDEKIDQKLNNMINKGSFSKIRHPGLVLNALETLELREQLQGKDDETCSDKDMEDEDDETYSDKDMEDEDNAICSSIDIEDEEESFLTEINNVVWRKLGDD